MDKWNEKEFHDRHYNICPTEKGKITQQKGECNV